MDGLKVTLTNNNNFNIELTNGGVTIGKIDKGGYSEDEATVAAGKSLIAASITQKGIPASPDNSFNALSKKILRIDGGGSGGGGTISELKQKGSVLFISSSIVPEVTPLISSSDSTTNGAVTFTAVAGHTYWISASSCGSDGYGSPYETIISYDASKFDKLYDWNMSETYGGKACILKCNEDAEIYVRAYQNSWWSGVIKLAFDISSIHADADNITISSSGDNTNRVYFNTIPEGKTYLYIAMATGRQRGYSGVADVSTSNLLYYYHVPDSDNNQSGTCVITTNNNGNIYTNTYDGATAYIFTIPTFL